HATAIVVSDIDGCLCFPLIGGFGGNQIDDAGGCVSAIQCTLRAAEHLHLGNVEEFLFEEMVADERDVIEGYGDRRIGRHRDGLGADAADLNVVAGEVRFGECQVGNLLDQIGAAGGLR